MGIQKDHYIIVEIIPTTRSKQTGEIAQISALKLQGLTLLDRFDYRLNPSKISIPDIVRITSYDKDAFHYLETTDDLLHVFSTWSEDFTLLILDNDYTKDYLSSLTNEKISICKILNMKYQDDIIDRLIEKYHLEPSNYIVDLLYESIIKSEKE
jgi:DNA polymerase III alpha subunit (gram-positive type)